MEKYGFVYIWYDRKHKRYYIGSHWGREADKYICSSSWMRHAYNRRKMDFKRRILSLVYTNRKDLLDEEFKWLDRIKDEELGKRYYNLKKHHNGHWVSDEERKLTVGQKISQAKIGKKQTEEAIRNAKEGRKKVYKGHSEETREKISKALTGRKLSQEHIEKNRIRMIGLKRTPETREKMRQSHLGVKRKPFTEQHLQNMRGPKPKVSEKMKGNSNALGKHRTWEKNEASL